MILISDVIGQALKESGVYAADGQQIPANFYTTGLSCLNKTIEELNGNAAYGFGESLIEIPVTDYTLTIKPYTTTENEIIASGGTIDVTNRVTSVELLYAPTVIYNGYELTLEPFSEVVKERSEGCLDKFAFILKPDCSVVEFNAIPNDTIKIVHNIPITIDSDPFGYVNIPKSFDNFLITKVSEKLAIRYQFTETASIMAQIGERAGKMAANSVTSRKPINHDVCSRLNKYRTTGRRIV